jgi:hypothetical protein
MRRSTGQWLCRWSTSCTRCVRNSASQEHRITRKGRAVFRLRGHQDTIEVASAGPQDELSSDAAALLDKLGAAWHARAGSARGGTCAAGPASAAAGRRARVGGGAELPAAAASPLRRAAARQASQQAAAAASDPAASQPAGAARPAAQSPRPLKRRAITRLSQEGF